MATSRSRSSDEGHGNGLFDTAHSPSSLTKERRGLLTSTSSPRSWSDQLTQRQRVLLHIEPLLRLYRQPGTRDQRHLRYDTLSLIVKLFDAIIDESGFGSEVTRDSVASAVRPLLMACDDAAGEVPIPSLHDEVIDRILAELKNEPNRQEPFEVPYQAFDDSGRPVQLVLRFKLLMEQFGYGGGIVLKLSSEAINLFLNAFGLDIEDAQVANEAVVQAQLERGRFNEAVQSAQNARGQSMRYEAKVRWLLLQISRDIDRVDWRGEADPLLLDAQDHVRRRLNMEDDILRSAQDKLDNLQEADEHRPAVAEIIRLMRDCRHRHLQLHEQIMPARGEFLRQQAKQVFVATTLETQIDLRDRVLRDVLSLDRTLANEALADAGHSLLGPQPPKVFSLKDLVLWQMMPKRQSGGGLMPVDGLEFTGGIGDQERRYPPEAFENALHVLAMLRVPTRLSRLLQTGETKVCDPRETDAMVLQTLGLFGGEMERSDIQVDLAEHGALQQQRHTGDDLWIIPLNGGDVDANDA